MTLTRETNGRFFWIFPTYFLLFHLRNQCLLCWNIFKHKYCLSFSLSIKPTLVVKALYSHDSIFYSHMKGSILNVSYCCKADPVCVLHPSAERSPEEMFAIWMKLLSCTFQTVIWISLFYPLGILGQLQLHKVVFYPTEMALLDLWRMCV